MNGTKRVNRAAAVLLALMMALTVVGPKPVKAAGTANISVTSATVEKGKDVTITVNISASAEIAIVDFTLKYDASKLQYLQGAAPGADGVIRLLDTGCSGKTASYSFSFKALDVAEGGTALTLSNVIISPLDDSLGDNFAVSPSNGSIKITGPYQASSNANLASLSIGEAKISPAFSADVTAYTASVGGTVSKVTVSAQPADGKAKVAVSGNSGLKEGANTVTVKVTAEDGKTTKTYTITVTRAKPPTPKPATPTPTPTPGVQIKVDDTELELKDKPDLKWMENTDEWDSTIVEYKNYKIGALENKNTGVIVVELSDGNLYILDTERNSATRYFAFESAKQNIVLQEITDSVIIPMGYSKTTRTIDGAEVTAYVTSDKSDYALVYGRNGEGFTGWFQYDMKTDTFQRFNIEDIELNPTSTPTPSPVPSEAPTPTLSPTAVPLPTIPETASTPAPEKSGRTFLEKFLFGTSGVLFVLMVVFLILYLVQKGRYNHRFAPDEDYSDDEDYL